MKFIIIGDGGHSKVIREMMAYRSNHELIAVLDDKYEFVSIINQTIYAPLAYLSRVMNKDTKVIIGIGNNAIRKRLCNKLIIKPDQYLTVIHHTAVVSPSAKIGHGTVVMPNALIHTEAKIGSHCIINTGSIVEHENSIGDYVHLSPNATLTGNVSIAEGVHIGAASTVIPGINIGNWSIIGAGSTVIKNIPAFSKAVGSPTRILNVRKELKILETRS